MSEKKNAVYYTIFEELFPKQASKSERRKIQIIEKTIEELASSGIDATNYESLAQSIGISRALIQHYFPDREELILITMKFIRAKYQKLCVDAIAAQTTPQGKLKAYLSAACSWPRVTPLDAKVWLLFYYNCSIKKEYRKLNTELVVQGQERIVAMLKDIGQSQKLTTSLSYPMKAKMIQGAILNYFLSTLSEDQSKSQNEEFLDASLELCYQIAGLK